MSRKHHTTSFVTIGREKSMNFLARKGTMKPQATWQFPSWYDTIKCHGIITNFSPIITLLYQVRKKRIELLQHPVVWSYLYRKWNHLGFWFFLIGVLIYGSFLCSLSIIVLSINDPQSEICKYWLLEIGIEYRGTSSNLAGLYFL